MSWASTMGKSLAFAVCATALTATGCFEVARKWMFESIDIAGATYASATDIDDRGRILGSCSLPGRSSGFLITYRDTSLIEVPQSKWTAVGGINSASQIVGSYADANDDPHGFLLDDGVLSTIEFPGATASIPTDISNRGAIVGVYQDPHGVQGFLLESGRFKTIDVPGAQRTNALGINDMGFVVGDWIDQFNMTHGFILRNGEFTILDVPGAIHGTSAQGINLGGKVVGAFIDASGLHGFVWDRGVFTTIDFPNANRTIAVAINERGDIVGEYADRAGRGYGFVARSATRKWSPHPTLPKLAAAEMQVPQMF